MQVRPWLLTLIVSAVCPQWLLAQPLWDRRDPNVTEMFHDYRARRVGDVLTVIIEETTGSDSQEKRELGKNTNAAISASGSGSTSSLGQVLRSFGFGLDLANSSQRSFDSKANSTIARTFTDRMTFVVIDVLPNGNLIVQGCRQRMITREMRTLRLTGIVRPADISPNNVVQSSYIGNLYISYEGRGPESAATNQNWGGRIFNKLWPFYARPYGRNDHDDPKHSLDHAVLGGDAGVLAGAGNVPGAQRGVRIKDITDLEGAQTNHMVGFGLVVGLNNTGGKSTFTQQVAIDMLQRFMVTTKFQADLKGDSAFKSGNISAVMVTTELGPFARVGSRIEVTVSALDDATSLDNGMLIVTPLKGVDGLEYVTAQGPVSVGGFLFTASGGGSGTAASAQKNHPTVGRVANGPLVVREARGKVLCNGQLKILLRDADYNTARAIAKVINEKFTGCAYTLDAGTVNVIVPAERQFNVVSFISEFGLLEITPDSPARVVINERTGTIVAGHNVKISTVAVTHGNLAIVTSNEPIVSQPNSFSRGKTKVLPRAQLGVTEQPHSVRVLDQTMTVAELARALNALGAAPRDLIVIFQALKRLGALHAELVFM